jgi:endonuclease/exonuclease/phosphatase family metal-dependent hydrolase
MAEARDHQPAPRTVRLATYNVHAFVGSDKNLDPGRVARVIEELHADVVALQEMTYAADIALETREPGMLPALSGYECALGPTRMRREDRFGNVLLSRLPIRDVARIDLSARRREPRGALHVVLDAFGAELHVLTAHLGLRRGERRVQVLRLVEAVASITGPLVILGDFNDWLPGRSVVHALDALIGSAGAPPSFPARWPVLALDRVWVRPRAEVISLRVHVSPLSRRASDHLPVIADVAIRSVRGAAELSDVR